MNQAQLSGILIERKPLRFTPSGTAVFEAVFHHRGEVLEAGAARVLEFDVPTIAFSDTAIRLDGLKTGTRTALKGFFAPQSLRSKRLVLHITEFILEN